MLALLGVLTITVASLAYETAGFVVFLVGVFLALLAIELDNRNRMPRTVLSALGALVAIVGSLYLL